jgi:hypothetical protein
VTHPRLGHLDESGRVCEVHPIEPGALLQLAAIGSRAPSFNHDIASKIQGVMMALDEIVELAHGDLKTTAEAAQGAMNELNQLLQLNRAMTKTPVSAPAPLHELLAKAAMRVGVTLRGTKAECEVTVAAPLMTQALAMAFDAAAGAERRRTLELGVKIAERVELVFPLAASAAPAGESLAIAAWIVEREHGTLRCGGTAIIIELPLAPPP